MPRTWLITGSSRGLGRALAEAALAAGENVVATARNPDQLQELVERYPGSARAVRLGGLLGQVFSSSVLTVHAHRGRCLVNGARIVGSVERLLTC